MGNNRCSGGSNHKSDGNGEKFVVKQLEGEFSPGDFIWAKLRGNIWWPAVVVDANTISECIKPCKRAAGDILVRLYGSYEYLYVDPIKCHLKFQKVLEQHNGSHREIFERALQRNLLKSSGSRGKGSTSAGKNSDQGSRKKLKSDNTSDVKRRVSGIAMDGENTRTKTSKPDENQNLNIHISETSSLRTSHEHCVRKSRVMQSLGLIAPSGSPFSKTGQMYGS